MRSLLLICAMIWLAHTAGNEALGQTAGTSPAAQTSASAPQTRVVGEVTAIDLAAGAIRIRADDNRTVALKTDAQTTIQRVPPGETRLEKAVKITLADIAVGDRLFVRGDLSVDNQIVAARQLVVMSGVAAGQSQGRDRGDGQSRRGIAGRIMALNPSKKEVTLQARAREGMETITVDASGNVKFLRYAPDSTHPRDAVPGSFAGLRVGDLIRARGERSADGTRFVPEEIYSGMITRFGGKIKAIDSAANAITIESEQRGRTFTVAVGARSTLRRVPPEVGASFAQRGERSGSAAASSTGARPRPGGRNFQEVIESLPAVTLSDLKKDDAVFIVGTEGANSSRVTAVLLLTGETDFISHLQRLQGRPGGDGQGLDAGLPGDVLGGGAGAASEGTTNRVRP